MRVKKRQCSLGILLLFLTACSQSARGQTSFNALSSLEASCRNPQYEMISASSPSRPGWIFSEPNDKDGQHPLIGISEYHATEKAARIAAMQHARAEFAKYTGVNVQELNEISHLIYGKSSEILDPLVIGKMESIQSASALVRRTRAKEWYLEKLEKTCGREKRGMAFQVWVLAEVPIEEYDKIQAWKAKQEIVNDQQLALSLQGIKTRLSQLKASHHETLLELETSTNRADLHATFSLLQADWHRLKRFTQKITSRGLDSSDILHEIESLQDEILETAGVEVASLILDTGRESAVWVLLNEDNNVDIPVWLWLGDVAHVLPVSGILLELKKDGKQRDVIQDKTDRNGKLSFVAEAGKTGRYQVGIDTQRGSFSALDPALKGTLARVKGDVSIVAFTPSLSNSVKIAVHRLFAGPARKAFPVETVVMGSARYGETRLGSALGRHLAKEIEREILSLNVVRLIRSQDKRSTRALSKAAISRGIDLRDRPAQPMNSPAMQALLDGANASLEARYVLEGNKVRINLRLIEATTGVSLAISEVRLDRDLVPRDLPILPPSISPENIPSGPESGSGDIVLELTTERGDGATFAEGETISYYVSSDRDAYLLLIYVDADGNRVQVFPNTNTGNGFSVAGDYFSIPDEAASFDFTIAAPFGIEQVWAFAASEPFPVLKGEGLSNGFTLLKKEFTDIVEALRRHGKKKGLHYGESNVMVTTVKE